MAKVLASPSRYIQGKNVLVEIGKHVAPLGKRALVLISEGGYKRVGERVEKSLKEASMEFVVDYFNGEASKVELDRLQKIMEKHTLDLVIGVGGGKILDTAKAVAFYGKTPVVVCPTSASTDAPCSALSVLYTEEGVFDEYLFLPSNPNMVLMDTEIVVRSPVRLTVAGMGDALATKFEARMAVAIGATNMVGGMPTKAAIALADLCFDILMQEGLKAKLAQEAGALTDAVEQIIEANTLLSGLGFESAGLSAAHSVHNGMTALEETHHCYHGEKVSFGVLTQLVLENAPMEEISEVVEFCLDVGLPVCLADLGVTQIDETKLREVAELAADPNEMIHNMPFEVDADKVLAAILAANRIGIYAKELRG